MGIVRAELFSTLDLVGQAPGGADEDPVNFRFGGWQLPLLDDVTERQLDAAYADVDALLLGRRTYDVFAGYWPHQSHDGLDGTIAELFNRVPKYVASRGRPLLDWEPTTLLGPDLTAKVDALRTRHTLVSVVLLWYRVLDGEPTTGDMTVRA